MMTMRALYVPGAYDNGTSALERFEYAADVFMSAEGVRPLLAAIDAAGGDWDARRLAVNAMHDRARTWLEANGLNGEGEDPEAVLSTFGKTVLQAWSDLPIEEPEES